MSNDEYTKSCIKECPLYYMVEGTTHKQNKATNGQSVILNLNINARQSTTIDSTLVSP